MMNALLALVLFYFWASMMLICLMGFHIEGVTLFWWNIGGMAVALVGYAVYKLYGFLSGRASKPSNVDKHEC